MSIAEEIRPSAIGNAWRWHGCVRDFSIGLPAVRMGGTTVPLEWSEVAQRDARVLRSGLVERRIGGPVKGLDADLDLIVRGSEGVPSFLRFHYVLRPRAEIRFENGADGRNDLRYLSFSLEGFERIVELRLGTFLESVHSFVPEETPIREADFARGLARSGPILTATDSHSSILLAYEHGSQFPNSFVEFQLSREREVAVRAVKGNYFHGQTFTPDKPWTSIWFQLGGVNGGEDELASGYREFLLKGQSANPESRKPYIFYNTWNHQERLKNWYKRPYLDEMHEERMLAEIDVAHRLGIEVFVIDTGWYTRTGDWEVNRERFPSGLRAVRQALESRGMRLGLWFNPTVAALTSRMWNAHRDCIQQWQGQEHPPFSVWETEESQGLCLVSRYADAYAEELIRLVRELGVTYFKWDAIGQEGAGSCDAPGHDHGTDANPAEERNACYAFEQVRAMCRIVDRVCEECPEAIFDFDVTEGGRSMGLAFLSSGKYFLINNGPYHFNYDLPPPADGNANLFFFPGPARSWICRAPLSYDRWLPSVLFLTHYLPDPPRSSQMINAVSLMLGQSGIWGDLLALKDEDVAAWNHLLSLYKQVRDDVVEAAPVRQGPVGGSPEIHEKIARNGRGLVAVFANAPGVYEYVTQRPVVSAYAIAGDVKVEIGADGLALLRCEFREPSACAVFFGAG